MAERAVLVALDSPGPLAQPERAALDALARALGEEFVELRGYGNWRPTAEARHAIEALAAHARARRTESRSSS